MLSIYQKRGKLGRLRCDYVTIKKHTTKYS